MTLTKIRRANKKWKHEQARRKHADKLHIKNEREKLVARKQRKEIVQARREQLKRRDGELAYVDKLTSEVLNEKS